VCLCVWCGYVACCVPVWCVGVGWVGVLLVCVYVWAVCSVCVCVCVLSVCLRSCGRRVLCVCLEVPPEEVPWWGPPRSLVAHQGVEKPER
jgi:hypothetical protein